MIKMYIFYAASILYLPVLWWHFIYYVYVRCNQSSLHKARLLFCRKVDRIWPWRHAANICTLTEAMWRVVMSEEVGKKVQAVVDRVNQAVSRRPKVSFHRFLLSKIRNNNVLLKYAKKTNYPLVLTVLLWQAYVICSTFTHARAPYGNNGWLTAG